MSSLIDGFVPAGRSAAGSRDALSPHPLTDAAVSGAVWSLAAIRREAQ